tara:strand:- start:110 stop:355 length:246 start_codon:yes stop_codon:yes gene_type:complete
MTNQELEAAKAAFLARGGAVTVASDGIAYGVDREADKAKRLAERDRLEAELSLQECERHAERVREAYHVGGRNGALAALND